MDKKIKVQQYDNDIFLTNLWKDLFKGQEDMIYLPPINEIDLSTICDELKNREPHEKPDVILMDVHFSLGSDDKLGIEAIKMIKEDMDLQHIRIIILSQDFKRINLIEETFLLGVNGFLGKEFTHNELISTIKQAFSQNFESYVTSKTVERIIVKSYFDELEKQSPTTTRRIIGNREINEEYEKDFYTELSPAQRVVFKLTCRKRTNEDIADILSINKTVVYSHKSEIDLRLNLIPDGKRRNDLFILRYADDHRIDYQNFTEDEEKYFSRGKAS